MLMTGWRPRPHLWSSGSATQTPSSEQAFHSSNVTSNRPRAKERGRVTRWAGISRLKRRCDPIRKEPAGRTVNSGQIGQSRKTAPGRHEKEFPFAAWPCSNAPATPMKTVSVNKAADRLRIPRNAFTPSLRRGYSTLGSRQGWNGPVPEGLIPIKARILEGC